MRLSLEYISSVVGGTLSPTANKNREIVGFFTDSRVPTQNQIYLALRGERVDGNSFVPELLSKGYAVITDNKENLSFRGDAICVPDVRNALQALARHYRESELSKVTIVGVTGSVGKTTTKDMIAHTLSGELKVHKTAGNANSQIGLPQTVLYTEPSVDCAVVELGMSLKGEMERIASVAMPDISVITNVGYSHIENLGSREAIRDEKLKISSFSPNGSTLILNGDELLLRNVAIKDKRVIYVSLNDTACQCYAKNISQTEKGTNFIATVFGEEYNVSLNVIGTHYVINSLFAMATAYMLGINLNTAAKRLSGYQSDLRRQHIYESNGHTVISDCYNASPESMSASLNVLGGYKKRRVAVLGDMLELGEETEKLHRFVGEYTENRVDVLVTYGKFSEYINDSSVVNEKYHYATENREELKRFLSDLIQEGDVVLYKASNGMKLFDLIV